MSDGSGDGCFDVEPPNKLARAPDAVGSPELAAHKAALDDAHALLIRCARRLAAGLPARSTTRPRLR